MFKRIAGTKDILPDQIYWWRKIEGISRSIFALYNYQEIRPPLVEEAGLFSRSLGESTEIVQKQMFLIKKDGDTYALRPEGTASIVRAYLENNLDKKEGFIKLYYLGPMFRLERPQKGRLRQFHHIGCEAIGSASPGLDAEVVSLADNLLKSFSISGYKIKMNTLGCLQDKKVLTETLRKGLKAQLPKLCADCQHRFKINALRILDCKNPGCIETISKLDIGQSHLCDECQGHFQEVRYGLESLKIDYEVAPHLVRGLDYYNRTVFEITHEDLGAQDAIGAGGRYNHLVKSLGGPDVGAVGFALGMERLFLVSKCQSVKVSADELVYVIGLGEEARRETLKLLDTLRKSGIAADTDYQNKSLKGALRKANDLKARFVVIIGEDELRKEVLTLKDMVSGEQGEVNSAELVSNIKNQISK